MNGPTLVDLRWRGSGGIGRVGDHLLTGLQALAPVGEWLLWGPADLADRCWPGARVATEERSPTAWFGQRAALRVPRCDRALFTGNIRPLRPVGRVAVSVLYDTIPLHSARDPLTRAARRAFLRAVGRLADRVVTISATSARHLHEEVGIPAAKLVVVPLACDRVAAERVRARRRVALGDRPTVVFVGRFAPHKNLPRLIEGFARSRAAASGARLQVIGGAPTEVADLARRCARYPAAAIEVVGRLPQEDLEDRLAGAWLVVQPSLEEGYGLPVLEAAAAGIPVIASTAEAHRELTGGAVPLFDPLDPWAIAAAIDDALARGPHPPPAQQLLADAAPDPAGFAARVVSVLDEVT